MTEPDTRSTEPRITPHNLILSVAGHSPLVSDIQLVDGEDARTRVVLWNGRTFDILVTESTGERDLQEDQTPGTGKP